MRSRCLRAGARGQATIELVLALPLLLAMLALSSDAVAAFRCYGLVCSAASEGARIIADDPALSDDEVRDLVRLAVPVPEECTVDIVRSPLDPKDVTMRAGDKSHRAQLERHSATVTVTAPVKTLLPYGAFGADGDFRVGAEKTAVSSGGVS